MCKATNTTTGPTIQISSPEEYRWFKCQGCGGDVGIPSDWKGSTVECPECGLSVRMHGQVLYRPRVETPAPQATDPKSELDQTSSANGFHVEAGSSPSKKAPSIVSDDLSWAGFIGAGLVALLILVAVLLANNSSNTTPEVVSRDREADGRTREAKWHEANALEYDKDREADRRIREAKLHEANPLEYANAFDNRGCTYYVKKEYEKAIADFSESVRLNPNNARVCNNIAWLLATCPKDELRNGKKAIEQATKACELSQWKDPYIIPTLAAAYAESGNFKEAVKWERKAIELGYAVNEQMEKALQLLKLYEECKPYREQ